MWTSYLVTFSAIMGTWAMLGTFALWLRVRGRERADERDARLGREVRALIRDQWDHKDRNDRQVVYAVAALVNKHGGLKE
jgi:hypothetical protein